MLTTITKHIEGLLVVSRFAGSLDANVILRLLLKDVPAQHEAALKLFNGSKGRQFAIADTAIIEVVFVLGREYELSRQSIVEALRGFMKLPELNMNRILFDRALDLYEDHPGLSFEDCCLATYADLNDAVPLWTFDKKLAKQSPNASLCAN